MPVKDEGKNNSIRVGEGFEHNVRVRGDNNVVHLEPSQYPSSVTITVNGNGNDIRIGEPRKLNDLHISVGNHIAAHNVVAKIGAGLSCEKNCEIFLYNSGNKLCIGEDCMFSRDIILRTGESPHLIFDAETDEYLDFSEGVFIGDHVWIGERTYITKKVSIGSGSIVAACSVVTKRFTETRVVLAGNPAKIARKGVGWFRNHSFLPEDSEVRRKWLTARKQQEAISSDRDR